LDFADEIVRLRGKGVTKVQIGVQSVNERILTFNRRGHTGGRTSITRCAGYVWEASKSCCNWMPNCLVPPQSPDWRTSGSCGKTWVRPDEIKIYPTALLENTPLYDLWQQGEYHPYSEKPYLSC
jgi:elongator complex protein 3